MDSSDALPLQTKIETAFSKLESELYGFKLCLLVWPSGFQPDSPLPAIKFSDCSDLAGLIEGLEMSAVRISELANI